MCGRGQSCFSLFHCRSCCCPFLRWKQIAKQERTTATEYLARLRRNYEHPRGYLRCSLLALRRDSFIICLIEVFIECRTRKCVRQRLVLFVFRAEIPKKIDARVFRHFHCGRPKPSIDKQTKPPPAILYPLLILVGFGVGRDG